jgi:hypothetical protein
MPNATVDGAERGPDGQNDTHRSVVSGLVGLIEHVQANLRLLEAAVIREALLGSQENATNVIVLDDVSPRYVRATEALRACDANLGGALRSLLDSSAPKRGSSGYAEAPPAFSMALV